MNRPSNLRAASFITLVFALGACSTDDDGSSSVSFVVKTASRSVAQGTPLAIDNYRLAFLADESTTGSGTDLNGDGDQLDSVAIRLNAIGDGQVNLGVAATALAWVSETLFMVVDESEDRTDWDGDSVDDDLVLLYNRIGDSSPTYLATLASPTIWYANSRLYYTDATGPGLDGDTDLFYVTVSSKGEAPDAATRVGESVGDGGDGLVLDPLARRGDILFFTADEAVEGDLNGDADAVDTVLMLLNTAEPGGQVASTAMAVDRAGDVAALKRQGDWWIAFLADEAAQGENLNDGDDFAASWDPDNCVGVDDDDQLDYVLQWLLWSDFVGSGNVVNTGLCAGIGAGERVYIHKEKYVGVVSYESDFGPAGCDLNADGDFDDRIFRWAPASDPGASVLPVGQVSKMVAVTSALPGASDGDTGGVVSVSNMWVIVVDEAADGRDWDGDAGSNGEWVLAHIPANVGQGWNADHGTGSPGPVAVSWMAQDPKSTTRFLAGFEEISVGSDLNGDGDQLDSVPTFPVKVTGVSGAVLSFPGYPVALEAENAGMVTGGGYGFYRVSEVAEEVDLNSDGDQADQILQRILIAGGGRVTMGTLNSFDVPAATVGGGGSPKIGAFLTQEAQIGATGKDLNKDGDKTDVVVRYFRY